MKYRSDVDGLRAVAVLPVIAFHMGVLALRGGFIGVDIFFVISGYLISARILEDIEKRQFSIPEFYVRRVRRIFPALAAMLAATTAVALFVIYPYELARYGASLAAAALSVSNFYFWNTTDYFDLPAQSKLLLHTWSLAVEEQYYFLFPPFILLATRWLKRRIDPVLWVLLIVSFAISAVGAFTDPSLTFYFPHTRMWEFLLGTILVRARLPVLEHRSAREAATLIGLALIVGSVLLLSEKQPFPGLLAVPGCLGAALIIAAGEHGDSMVGRLLGWWPPRLVGVISYSLYLWHWPVIVFFKEIKPAQFLSMTDKLVVAAITLVLAVLSWRFVEQPFRKARHARRWVFGTAGVATAALVVVGFAIKGASGLPGRFSPREQELARYQEDLPPARAPGCFIQQRQRIGDFDRARCLTRASGRPNVLLLGDSHANHLWYGYARHGGVNLMELAVSGCLPRLVEREAKGACGEAMRFAFDDYLVHNPVDLVLLSGRWSPRNTEALGATIDYLHAHRVPVAISGPIVEYEAALPKLLALSVGRNDPALPARHRVADREEADRMIREVAAAHGVPYLSPYRALCPDPKAFCRTLTPLGAPVQQDYGHLTPEGSDWVAAELLKGRNLGAIATEARAAPALR